jgi:hypothetical protein
MLFKHFSKKKQKTILFFCEKCAKAHFSQKKRIASAAGARIQERWESNTVLLRWEVDKNVITFYFDSIYIKVLTGRATQDLTGTYIEAGTVPGASHNTPFKCPLTERSTNMCTVICESVNFPLAEG